MVTRMLKGRRWAGVLTVVVAAGLLTAGVRSLLGAQAPTAAALRTAAVTRGDLIVSVSGSGSISPASEVEVKSRANGTVREVTVQEGDRVTAGQILVRIDDPDAAADVRTAQATLQEALARLGQSAAQRVAGRAQDATEVRQAEASLAAARARLRQVEAGSRPEEIAQAQESVRAAQGELDLARRTYERSRTLFDQGFIAQQEVDEAEARLRAAESASRSAAERVKLLRAGSTAAEIDEARAAVHQAEASLERAGAAQLDDRTRAQEVAAAQAGVSQARTALANAQDRLAETLIRAPVAGLVSERSVEVGQSVIGSASGGTAVMTLAVDRPVLAKVMVDEADIAQIRRGMAAAVEADGLPEEEFAGKVTAIAPNAETVNNVVQYEVTVSVDDPRARLRLGMTVDADFIVLRREGVLQAPRAAVRSRNGGSFVLVLEGEDQVPRTVQTGATDGATVEITSGLREGDVIILGAASNPAGTGATQQQRNPFMPQFPQPQRSQGPARQP